MRLKTCTHIVKYHQDGFEMRFLLLRRRASVPIRSSVGRWLKAKEPLQGAGEKICPLQVWFGRRGCVCTASGLKPHSKGHILCLTLFGNGCLMFSSQVITFFVEQNECCMHKKLCLQTLNLNPATMTTHVVADHDEIVTQNIILRSASPAHKDLYLWYMQKSV